MVDHSEHRTGDADAGQGASEPGERIAKVLARAGVASRREVERLIAAGRVTLNGQRLTTPAVKVSAADVVTLDGQVVAAAEATRVFRYHKPPGLVTSHSDPKGRPTVFQALPEGLPRLISVGRLDLNSEGLLLLTNDGGLARALELPANAWTRRYRARAHGRIDQARLDKLKDGVTVEGVRYGAIDAKLESGKEGATNVWITLTLTEGKNREVRRVLEALGLAVNRLIRVSYGPFELGTLPVGKAEEVGPQIVRERLGAHIATATKPAADAGAKYKPGWAKPKPKPKSSRRPGSAPGPSHSSAPRGPKPSASPPRSSDARPRGPRPKGGPKRSG
jgi:23S rRNA pseudouridine2605 synthase